MQPSIDRATAISRVEAALGDRRLIWLGKRGADAEPLAQLRQFSGSFSTYAPLSAGDARERTLENLTGLRIDTVNLDEPLGSYGHDFLASLRHACEPAAVLVAYRPYGFLWSEEAKPVLARFLGGSYEDYAMLGHKPMVERGLATEAGVKTLPWTYFVNAPEDLGELERAVHEGPVVLRANESSGGAGLELIQSPGDLGESSLLAREMSLAWSPFLSDAIPLNVAGCVFRDGGVTLHSPSVQIIGLPQCTPHRFGYCGNDFAAVRDLEPGLLDELENMALAAGRWLHGRGFIGAFGIDAMAHEESVLFTEINARFQGSSRIAAGMEREAALTDVYLDHMMAWLGMPSHRTPPLRELAHQQDRGAHVICYNTRPDRAARLADGLTPPENVTVELVPDAGIDVTFDAVLFALRFECQVTANGSSLEATAGAIVEAALAQVQKFAADHRNP